MTTTIQDIIEFNAEVPTWLGVGGRADLLARPRTVEDLRDLIQAYAGEPIRVLGDGANLLVHDDGVDGLVISLEGLNEIEYIGFDPVMSPTPDRPRPVSVRVGAGVNLPKLIIETVRHGLGGLEPLAGIPATVGGAVFMNAGGAFGAISDVVQRVEAITRLGDVLEIPHDQIGFDYRHSGLGWLVITAVELDLTLLPPDPANLLRQRLKDVMAYKKGTQPLKEDSAGCAFKNPTVRGVRVSAGRLIEEAGCKGLRVGGAEVSDHHANFIVTHKGCKAVDVIELMQRVADRVENDCGAKLDPEIAIWGRSKGGRREGG